MKREIDMKSIKCIECGSSDVRTARKDMEFERSNPGKIRIEKQECMECSNCGEIYFDGKQSDSLARKIDSKMKS